MHKKIKAIAIWLKYLLTTNIILIKELFRYLHNPQCPTEYKIDYSIYSSLIKNLRLKTDKANSPFYSFLIYSQLQNDLLKNNYYPKRILEIGTGSNLGVLFCHLLNGAEKGVGVDVQKFNENNLSFYELLKDYLACVGGFRWWRNFSHAEKLKDINYPNNFEHFNVLDILRKIEYKAPYLSDNLPFDDNVFDFVYSIAAFEHFENPEGTVQEIKRVLCNNSLTIHEIDLSHHGNKNPLSFLTLSKEEYLKTTVKYGGGFGIDNIIQKNWNDDVYCNRLRLSDYIEIFEKNSFKLLKIVPIRTLNQNNIDINILDAEFKNKKIEDLAIIGVKIIAQCFK